MLWIYSIPFIFLNGIFGIVGAFVAVLIMALGVLRFTFLLVLLITGDMTRLKAEQTEGYDVIAEKCKKIWAKIEKFFK